MEIEAPIKGAKHYLDTSALIGIAALKAKAAGKSLGTQEEKRGIRVTDFIRRVVANGGTVRTSILAVEELAAKVRNESRKNFLQNHGCTSWKEFEQRFPQQAQNAVTQAHAQMLLMMEWATDGLGGLGGSFEHPAVMPTETEASAFALRKAHRRFLHQHPKLDPMDALHILLGIQINAQAFISLDKAWSTVTTITVYQ